MQQLTYQDKTTIKVLLFTLFSVCIAIPYYFSAGGTILGFLFVRVFAAFINNFGQIGWHRWLTHNSFKPNLFGKYIMLFGMLMNGFGKPIHAIMGHRMHHAHTDTALDPHSPKNDSFLKIWLGRYRVDAPKIIPKDFYRIKEAVFLNNHYWKLYIAFNLIFALIDLKTALIFCPITFAYGWFLNAAVNYLGHRAIGSNIVEPRNLNKPFTFLVFGEGMHKNHHDNQTSYRFGRTQDGDLSAWMIEKFLKEKTK